MAPPRSMRTVRRSVVLPADLVDEAIAQAPPELRENFSRLTVTALREFSERRRAAVFADAMAAMAADPAIRGESRAVAEEFTVTEADGLGERA